MIFQFCRFALSTFSALFLVAYTSFNELKAQDVLLGTDPLLQQNPLVTQAYSLFENGDPGAALEAFQEALVHNGADLSALLGEAMVFADLQRHKDAFVSYDTIVKTYPEHAFAWNGRGLAAFNLEDFDEALKSFEKATAEHPVNGFFYESLAWTYMCRGEFLNAADSAKKATLMYGKKNESSAYPLLIAYFAFLGAGDLQNAEKTLRYASKSKPINRWPAPVIDYLSRKITANELISFVNNTAQETEAHTYLGLHLRSTGHEAEGMQHLEWVIRQGDPRVFEYTLARALNLQNSVAALVSPQ